PLPAAAGPAVQPAAFEGAEPELVGYTREAHTEIEALFPALPNPELVLYVYPHLGEDGAPVPGYATAFPLYERVEYALPGEVP
ncbi:MAG: TIGR03751 family conjugal transfer lipoprotein, partial [Actinomycetota bacterium]